MKNVNSDTRLSRRQWLGGVTALAATAMDPARRAFAQAGAARPYRIDTHHHYTGDWTPSRALEGMDQTGIAAAILSRPGIPVSDPEKARKLARDTNEHGAQLARDYPGRFGLFATLPLFDVEGSLREIAHGFDELKADGMCLVTSYGNAGYGTRWPGDPLFAPVFDELNRRRAVVFIHPTVPSYYTDDFRLQSGSVRGVSGINETALENQFDTARAIVSLIINGTLIRCPFDLVRVANPANLALLTRLMPAEHLLFGTDYPPVPISETASQLPGLRLDGKVLRGIERDNALTLFPRFKS